MYQPEVAQAVEEPEMLPVFVYGTLRPGQHNFVVAESYVDHTEAALVPNAAIWSGPGFPYAVHVSVDDALVPAGSEIVGDLLYINPEDYDDALRSMDRLEGISVRNDDNGHYRRIQVQTRNGAGEDVTAWMYVAGRRVRSTLASYFGTPIVTGDWLNR